ncbi:MAG: alpha/beta fold hydrolase [Planctomycetes bacterium]|nr:alpha/beta fold hydrolase [Planctomycetota bacterium]
MIDISAVTLADVPCLVVRAPTIERRPLLIWHHGWSGHKGDPANPSAHLLKLAQAGLVVVCPDAPGHGERANAEFQRRRQFNGWAVICAAMEQARGEAGPLLDAALALPGIAPTYACVAGVSMGGVIAQLAFASEPRFAALVSVIGRSSLHQADPWCRDAQRGTWCERWCDQQAPSGHPERFGERPVLFVDGGLDDDCPAAINAETVARINAAGGRAEHSVDPACGHDYSESMQDSVRTWIRGQVSAAILHACRYRSSTD